MSESEAFNGWAFLELMGHKKVAGHVQEVSLAGSRVLRVDIPSEPPLTQFYGGASIYCMTPCSEDIARRYHASASRPLPVHPWELSPQPALETTQTRRRDENGDEDSFGI